MINSIYICCLFAFTLATVPVQAEASTKKPNILIMFADDLGYSQPSGVSDRSRFAGDNNTIHTPNLDRLAQEGLTFTNWYSAHHVCSPSHDSSQPRALP